MKDCECNSYSEGKKNQGTAHIRGHIRKFVMIHLSSNMGTAIESSRLYLRLCKSSK
jgi:hypothetical protein